MNTDQHNPIFAFFGTPDIAAETLEILHQGGYTPAVIICAPDRPVGRKQIITPPPTKIWAQEHDIPVLQPEKLGKSFRLQLETYNLELSITAAYGMIMPTKVINIPDRGTLNIHYSLLPKHRGAIPTQAAILDGDDTTGVTIQQMQYKLDSGPIVAQEEVSLGGTELAPDLQKVLTKMGAELMVKIFPDYIAGKITPREQDHSEATHETKLSKSDGEIHLDDPDIDKWRKYRAFYTWPGIFFFVQKNIKHRMFNIEDVNHRLEPDREPSDVAHPHLLQALKQFNPGTRIKITEAEFVDGKFVIKKIIPEGGKEVSI